MVLSKGRKMASSKPNYNIVFLHGPLGTSKDLGPLIEIFRMKGHQPHTFDFSGHGPGNKNFEGFRVDSFAKELDLFLKKNNIKSAAIFGYSLGGYIALYHKAHFEDSPISFITTYGTKFNWSPKILSREMTMLDPEYIISKLPQLAETLHEKHGEDWKMVLKSTAHMFQNLERLDGLTKEDLEDIDIPITLVHGDQDRTVTSEETQLTSSWLRRARVKTLANSKHELDKVNLKELTEMIEENLE
jgi:esterase/lipase